MQGLHLTADLWGCDVRSPLFTRPEALRELCLASVHDSGLAPVGQLFHRFDGGGGVTGVVLLAESHLAVHTWPEQSAVTIDVYVCNFSGDNSRRAEGLMQRLITAFSPATVERQQLRRGELPRDLDPARLKPGLL